MGSYFNLAYSKLSSDPSLGRFTGNLSHFRRRFISFISAAASAYPISLASLLVAHSIIIVSAFCQQVRYKSNSTFANRSIFFFFLTAWHSQLVPRSERRAPLDPKLTSFGKKFERLNDEYATFNVHTYQITPPVILIKAGQRSDDFSFLHSCLSEEEREVVPPRSSSVGVSPPVNYRFLLPRDQGRLRFRILVIIHVDDFSLIPVEVQS